MLKPGTYKLTQDVVNPRPDKRKRNDWTAAPFFEAGSTIVVLDDRRGDGFFEVKCTGHSHHDYFATTDERAAAMEPFLEPIPETIGAMFVRLGLYSWNLASFLRYLIEKGVFTPAEFEKHLDEWLNQPEE